MTHELVGPAPGMKLEKSCGGLKLLSKCLSISMELVARESNLLLFSHGHSHIAIVSTPCHPSSASQ
ncbi:hypothetical protein BGX38DRAFT_465703 [Terfezia claveryi]|nr:hypothetical protein BGX38DRAFT_465703 [Terfezia claveryi]